MKKKNIIMYTDGSSLGNPGRGGWAALLLENEQPERCFSGGFRLTTNNRMELLAIIEGLSNIEDEGYDISIYTDSQLISDSVNKGWLNKWIKNGWKKSDKTDVLNVDLWKKFVNISKNHKVKINWIKGHNGEYGNEMCDKLSKAAAEKATAVDEFYENSEKKIVVKTIFDKENLFQNSTLQEHCELLTNDSYRLILSNDYIIVEDNSKLNKEIVKFKISDKQDFIKKISKNLHN